MLKKGIAALLTFIMIVSCAGCGEKKEAVNENTQKGRYVEREIELPEGIAQENVFQIEKKGDKLCLYVKEEKDGSMGIASYRYEDGGYERDTSAWLESLSFDMEETGGIGSGKIIENVNGKSYLYCTYLTGENTMGHLYRSEDGIQAEEITPTDWLVEHPEYHFFECPQDVGILEDDTIVASFYSQAKIYSGADRSLLQSITYSEEYSESIYADKNTYYLLSQDYNSYGMSFKGIDVYKQGADSVQETYLCEKEIGAGNHMDILSDGSFVVCGQNGLFKLDSASGEWSILVEGIYTSMSDNSMWCVDLTALDNGTCYALFAKEEGEKVLMEYVYDPDMPTMPETVLTVYSVYDNVTLKQAAAMYTKKHPDVLVQVEVGVPAEEVGNVDFNTLLQNLNTKLLAGEGADILVLDDLNTKSFIEKGILADISDIVTPMAEEGTLLKNIVDGYTSKEGEIYLIPLKFSLNLLIGRTIDAEKAGSLEDMSKVLSKEQESVLGAMTANDLATVFVPYMVSDIVKEKALDKEAFIQKLEYLKAIAENSGIVEKYPENGGALRIWDIASSAGAAFYDVEGFLQSMLPIAAAKLVNGSYDSFENAYRPIGQVGINADSENVEEAKNFIRYALSFEAQDGDFYDGFAINTQALENQVQKDRSDYAMYTEIAIGGGQYTPFEIGPISEEDAAKLLNICKSVNKKMVKDKEIIKAVTEALPLYLNGESTLEDTVTKIERSLNMYLAE